MTKLVNKCSATHILKKLTGHRNINTKLTYLDISLSQMKLAVEMMGQFTSVQNLKNVKITRSRDNLKIVRFDDKLKIAPT